MPYVRAEIERGKIVSLFTELLRWLILLSLYYVGCFISWKQGKSYGLYLHNQRERKRSRKPLIYIAHPFGGKDENFILAKKYIMALQECHRDKAFISPVIAYGYCYHAHTYERGINMCLDLLAKCDELWILGDDGISKGVKLEREYAKEHGMPIKEFKTQLDAVEGKEII